MLMIIENLQVEAIHSHDEEGEVDIEGEMVSALYEIERLRKKNKTQKESPMKEKVEDVEPLLEQLEEGKKIQETLNQQLNEKVQVCVKLEGKIVLLRKELEKSKTRLSFN